MARILSDTVIIAMIEAATRLAGGRGPIAGSSPAPQQEGAPVPPVQPDQANPAPTTEAAPTPDGRAAKEGTAASSDHDTRTADQIGADFRTIFGHIDEVVRTAAEQETKSVGFAVR
jgi:hypothetical protein